MNSLWMILLDTSGSMGGPFSGVDDFQGQTEIGKYPTKIDAAKDLLLKRTRSIPSGDIAIVAFSSQPYLVCKGQATESKNFEEEIQSLESGGGTNTASAILFALTNVEHSALRAAF